MALRYKFDIMAELKKKGYSSTRLRTEKLLGESYMSQLRHGDLVEHVKEAPVQETAE